MQSGDAVRTGMGWEFDAIAAVAVGAICGVLIIGFLANAFNLMGINPYWQRIVIGLVLAVAVVAYNERIRAFLLSRRRAQQPARIVPAPAE
jgi:ribose/xylose/arabinose/galactoside ABC-type transport system permease subunit